MRDWWCVQVQPLSANRAFILPTRGGRRTLKKEVVGKEIGLMLHANSLSGAEGGENPTGWSSLREKGKPKNYLFIKLVERGGDTRGGREDGGKKKAGRAAEAGWLFWHGTA